jgi:hypothetical protein
MKTIIKRNFEEFWLIFWPKAVTQLLSVALGVYALQWIFSRNWMLLDWGFLPLAILSIALYLVLLAFNWWLFHSVLSFLGLTPFNAFISNFKQLTLWQQFLMYWGLFACLFLGLFLSFLVIL